MTWLEIIGLVILLYVAGGFVLVRTLRNELHKTDEHYPPGGGKNGAT